MRRYPILSADMSFTRYCPETGDEVDVTVEVRGEWFRGQAGTLLDPPIPPGVETLWVVANGREWPSIDFPAFALSHREHDTAAEALAEAASW